MALGDKWIKIRGFVGSIWQLGLGGPNLKNSAGVVEVKNAADSAYADVRMKQLVLNDADTNKVTINVPALGSDYTLTLPADDGSPSQVLATDGNGLLSWATVAAGNDKIISDTTTLAFGDASPKAMFTLPANAVVHRVTAYVDTAFNGGTPTASVGVNGGSASKYMAATDLDLKTVGVYEVMPGQVANGSSENLEIAYAASGSTAGSARFVVEYSIPS